ncbi:MAG: carboxypeptidase regulatory-like domain-containing protein [Mariprofundaceae bacterium]
MRRTGRIFLTMLFALASLPAWAGSIAGTVKFSGAVPGKERFIVAKNPEVCGSGAREVEWVRVVDGKLSQVVVYIDGIDGARSWPAEAQASMIDQKDCAFTPHMQVVRNGGEVEVRNSDPVQHNIHTYELIGRAMRTVFNVNQPNEGVFKQTVNLKRGKWLKLGCDAHDFMHAWVFVASNPYYAVTGDDGKFNISDVPAGEYKVVAYHPTLGKQKAVVMVGASAASAEFSFSE